LTLTPEPFNPKRPDHYPWAVLITRTYEVFPLSCPLCDGRMRTIAFIPYSVDIRHILNRIGVSQSRHTSFQRVGSRCGTNVMRRRL